MTQCKPGDLAMVVRNSHGLNCVDHFIGTPIKVEHLIMASEYPWGLNTTPAWLFAGPPLRCPRCGGGMVGFLDADLQPLRPGPSSETTNDSQDIRRGEVAHG